VPDGPTIRFINPRDLSLICGSNRLLESITPEQLADLYSASPQEMVLDGNWDEPLDQMFAASDLFTSFQDVILRNKEWSETPYYARAIRRIGKGRSGRFKSPASFDKRCAELTTLYKRIKANGYLTLQQLKDSGQEAENEITVALDRNGRLMFLDGQHRLTIAKILELPAIPVRIVLRHPRWIEFRESLRRIAQSSPDGKLPEQIPHPDLEDIPARRGPERFEMLRAVLKKEDPRKRRLLHIGAGWGLLCQRFEELGFQCTALEKSPEAVRHMNDLRLACNRHFQIWQGTILGFPNLKPYDVILALDDILRPFTQEKMQHKRLVKTLRAIRARIVFFSVRQPEPADPRQIFHNYEPDEFAEFVAKHTRMTRIETIGETEDGEILYKISGPTWARKRASAHASEEETTDGEGPQKPETEGASEHEPPPTPANGLDPELAMNDRPMEKAASQPAEEPSSLPLDENETSERG